MKRLYLLIAVFFSLLAQSQTLTGMSGLLNIPSAEMKADGTLMMGANYLPAINQPVLGYPTGNYYVNLTFLPFVEASYKCTLLKIYGRYTNQDRGASFRLRFLKESNYLPAIAVGINDFYGTQYYLATYLVLTKHVTCMHSVCGITLGYGPDIFKRNQYRGLFGGFSLNPSFLKHVSLMGEYDSQGFNFGAGWYLFNHLYVFSMIQHLQYVAGGLAYIVYF